MTIVLDASALLAYLKDEPGSTVVDRILAESVERGEWQSIPNLQQEIEQYRLHARAYLSSTQQITVDLPLPRGDR